MADPDDSEGNHVREAVERSRATAHPRLGRWSATASSDEIFQRILAAADEEIRVGKRELFFSGLAAGFAITITFLLYTAMTAKTGGDPVLSAIPPATRSVSSTSSLGDYQLFTENTLPPVALVLERLASVPALLGIWGASCSRPISSAASPGRSSSPRRVCSRRRRSVSRRVRRKGHRHGLVDAVRQGRLRRPDRRQGRLGRLRLPGHHLPARAGLRRVPGHPIRQPLPRRRLDDGDGFYLVFQGELALTVGVWEFVLPVLLGNSLGGVALVTVVNYFQTTERRVEAARSGTSNASSLRPRRCSAGSSVAPTSRSVARAKRASDEPG